MSLCTWQAKISGIRLIRFAVKVNRLHKQPHFWITYQDVRFAHIKCADGLAVEPFLRKLKQRERRMKCEGEVNEASR